MVGGAGKREREKKKKGLGMWGSKVGNEKERDSEMNRWFFLFGRGYHGEAAGDFPSFSQVNYFY